MSSFSLLSSLKLSSPLETLSPFTLPHPTAPPTQTSDSILCSFSSDLVFILWSLSFDLVVSGILLSFSSRSTTLIRLLSLTETCHTSNYRPIENESQSNEEHCNYFKFADDADEDITSTIRSNTGLRKAIRTEEFNDVRTRLSEVDNIIQDQGRRLQRIEKNFKAMIYVIVLCIILYFVM
ncbi:uncharacterized protein LOC114288657 [Camellia sinensis]|uniref:uncharacterized protein LOC114288657 n=1 Tax=Camellia sinensis TaxID=4442 RepID=UPI001035B008|nr:uncharacterized protein LOC114288657 [Camellia sinensis]